MSLTLKLFSRGALYASARLSSQVIGFLMLPVYAIYLGQDGYGALSLVNTLGTVVAILLLQGQGAAWFRLRFRLQGSARQKMLTTIFWYVMLSMLVGLALISALGPSAARLLLPGVPFFPLVILGLADACAKNALNLHLRTLQAQERAARYFTYVVLQALTSAAVGAYLVIAWDRGVQGRLEAALAASLLCFLIGALELRPGAPWHASKESLKEATRYGWPLVWHQLSNWVNSLSDRLIVNHFLGLAAAGLYSMGYKLASVVTILSVALNQALTSQMYRSLSGFEALDAAGKDARSALIRRIAGHQLAVVAMFGFGLVALSREALILMSRGTFEQANAAIPIIAFALIVHAAYQPLVGVLAFFDRTRLMPLISSSGAASNVVLNLLLVPLAGIAGAALATAFSNALMLALGYRHSTPLFRSFDRGLLLRLFAVSGALLASIAWIDARELDWKAALPLKLGLVVLGGAVTLRAIGTSPKRIWRVVRQQKTAPRAESFEV